MLEYVPDTVYRINKHYTKNEQVRAIWRTARWQYSVAAHYGLPCCCGLKRSMPTCAAKKMPLCFMPICLPRPATSTRSLQRMPIILVKLYTYQMLRALAHIHSIGVCHRWAEGGKCRMKFAQ